jgi:hypothetical protein
MPFRFLHCSDIHLLNLQGTGPTRFLNKRLTGGVNLWLNRGRKHDQTMFTKILDAARAAAVDRVIITDR